MSAEFIAPSAEIYGASASDDMLYSNELTNPGGNGRIGECTGLAMCSS